MQLMHGGSLMQALQGPSSRQQLRWAERGCQVALDIAEALDYLHTQLGILHSDLKPANVMLSADWRASISDLGVAQVVGCGARPPLGYNEAYAAPEQLLGACCTLAADIYSFGVLLVALLTQLPVIQRDGWRLPCAPQECPQEVVGLIEECLATDPQHRPTAAATLPLKFRCRCLPWTPRSPHTMFAAALSQPRLASGLQRRAPAPRSSRGSRLVCSAKLVLTPVGTGKTEHIGEEVAMPGAIELKEGLFELGRADPADIIIAIPTVSTRHAMLRVADTEAPAAGSVQVTDLGSTNGTSLDGEELEPMKAVALPVGGEVIFGDKHLAAYRLDFVPDGPPAAAPAGEEAPAAAVAAASEAPAAAGQE
ncbi:serine threonine-kinase [Micractinium conductrix]|uniref:Serine threonine-kinase n=1 Tax=Micractinium conductrix TaxID=554055 RepID=A0A2P6VKU2_9CHLO|nr:serine threonine-kinase [Micractinium conductrix]|eukprot:PSC74722.1 serine threonine-kinase [Micractinium conductrix]